MVFHNYQRRKKLLLHFCVPLSCCAAFLLCESRTLPHAVPFLLISVASTLPPEDSVFTHPRLNPHHRTLYKAKLSVAALIVKKSTRRDQKGKIWPTFLVSEQFVWTTNFVLCKKQVTHRVLEILRRGEQSAYEQEQPKIGSDVFTWKEFIGTELWILESFSATSRE